MRGCYFFRKLTLIIKKIEFFQDLRETVSE